MNRITFNSFRFPIALVLIIGLGILYFQSREENKHLRNSLDLIPGTQSSPETIWVPVPYEVKVYRDKKTPDRVAIYPNQGEEYPVDSLIDLQVSKKQFSISLLGDSSVIRNLYNLDLDRYEYSFSNGQLTQKKVRSFITHPYISGSYKPFTKQVELSGGLLFETSKLNYKLGVGCYYINQSVKPDIEFGITYKF